MSYTYLQEKNFAEAVLSQSYLLSDAVNWINRNLSPEDVFDDDALEVWAFANGFVEEGGDDEN